ncbi:MAG: hypothetical protein OEM52_03650 [bacterium]|nr:hypothetical protein [bacterium]
MTKQSLFLNATWNYCAPVVTGNEYPRNDMLQQNSPAQRFVTRQQYTL